MAQDLSRAAVFFSLQTSRLASDIPPKAQQTEEEEEQQQQGAARVVRRVFPCLQAAEFPARLCRPCILEQLARVLGNGRRESCKSVWGLAEVITAAATWKMQTKQPPELP